MPEDALELVVLDRAARALGVVADMCRGGVLSLVPDRASSTPRKLQW
ncbi:TPA: hypothetical protein QDB06_001119 [Burkholderia vietnamiensis]|nr:hypothetical protein [Burkholderia vietnamiensis]MBR7974582.1 hypothetical protein [Burkholderia vietnamiensis]MBR8036312.1 hypothetical protein [Burkholderia vietnamiensis]MCA8184436.1 hypothetical protein [Burkholderia vietnamiensis]UEB99693.1 hypothetical protein LK462_02830 [Burkholderia vietnamiensis]HDR9180590.1 hypothetical protein [Burkholderia vietnamiensis]